jgi:hypothetical protein
MERRLAQPSFLGHHDLAALAAVAIAMAAAGIVAGRANPRQGLFATALLAGILGLVLAGSVAAAGGLRTGAAVLWICAPPLLADRASDARARRGRRGRGRQGRRGRGDALEDFLRFVGVRGDDPPQGVETYSQRTVLAYIGLRIWQENPILGVGWQRSSRPEIFEPFVPRRARASPTSSTSRSRRKVANGASRTSTSRCWPTRA